ncbi:hypothetical protein OH77DRAFT_218759 [Trametes cingulata]|nr:hypothetical protein OH77DRAFT_218759 [Trametes cingulata]
MSHSEDAQPNEVRHARKGSARVPAIRSSQSILGLQLRGSGYARGRAINRGRGRGSSSSSRGPPFRRRGAGSEASRYAGRPRPHGGSGRTDSSSREFAPEQEGPAGNHAHRPWDRRKSDGLSEFGVGHPSSVQVVDSDPSKFAAVPPILPGAPQSWPNTISRPGDGLKQEDDWYAHHAHHLPCPSTPAHTQAGAPVTGARPSWQFEPQHPALSITLARLVERFCPPAPGAVDGRGAALGDHQVPSSSCADAASSGTRA